MVIIGHSRNSFNGGYIHSSYSQGENLHNYHHRHHHLRLPQASAALEAFCSSRLFASFQAQGRCPLNSETKLLLFRRLLTSAHPSLIQCVWSSVSRPFTILSSLDQAIAMYYYRLSAAPFRSCLSSNGVHQRSQGRHKDG